MKSAEDLADFTCDGCSGEKCKNEKSKSSPSRNSKKAPIKNDKKKQKGKQTDNKKGKKSLSMSQDLNNSTVGNSSSGEAMTYGERNTDVTVKMFAKECKGKHCGKNCDGWEDVTRIGAHWYISDVSQTSLFDDGSLCEGCASSCNLCLGDGSYVFRVTGPTFNSTEDERNTDFHVWEFCHGRGYFNDQMNFHIKKGKCYPDDLRWSNEICEEEQESIVTASGIIALGGITSEFFAQKASTMVLDALAKTVPGWAIDTMAVTATSLDARSLLASSENRRLLPSYTHDIQFSVSFVAEEYTVNGAAYSAVESLITDMMATLEASFATGVFAYQLRQDATTMDVDALQEVTTVELVSLEIDSIHYASSHLVYYYGDDEVQSVSATSSSNGISTTITVVFLLVVAAGFVAFVGISRHGMSSYKKLNTISDSSRDHKAEMSMNVRTPFGVTSTKYKPVSAAIQV